MAEIKQNITKGLDHWRKNKHASTLTAVNMFGQSWNKRQIKNNTSKQHTSCLP